MSPPVAKLKICEEESTDGDCSNSKINHALHLALQLPETLAIIFSHLCVSDRGWAAQVCGDWRDACEQVSVWRDATFKHHPCRPIPAAVLQRRLIRKFDISGLKSRSFRRAMRALAGSIPVMQSARFTDCGRSSDVTLRKSLPTSGLPNMTHLSFSFCFGITDASMALVSRLMPNLVSVEIVRCDSITDNAVLFLVVGLQKLENLQITSLTEKGTRYLSGQINWDDPAIRTLLQSHQLLETGASGDVALSNLAARRYSIVNLKLNSCPQVTDESLLCLSGMPELKQLSLLFCNSVTDVGIGHLAKMANLREFKLTYSDAVSDHGLELLAKMPGLQSLSFHACPYITSVGVQSLSRCRSGITFLDLNTCHGLEMDTLHLIANGLFQLRELRIEQHHYTKASLHLASFTLCHLKIIYVKGQDGFLYCYTRDILTERFCRR